MAILHGVQGRFAPIICCLALAGCVKPTGSPTLTQLSTGTSTVQNAVALLGQPTHTEFGNNGTSILTWDPTAVPYVGDGTPTVIKLTFGSDGKLLDEKLAKVDLVFVPDLYGP
jgi:hypothetical protein